MCFLGDEGFDSIVEDAGKSFGFDSTEWLVSYRSRVREVFLICGPPTIQKNHYTIAYIDYLYKKVALYIESKQ